MRISWTHQKIRDEALKYQYPGDFKKHSTRAYDAARHRGILKEICSHMTTQRMKITKKRVIAEAKKYKTTNEFRLKAAHLWDFARKNGFLSETKELMENPRIKWDEEAIREEAGKYSVKAEFIEKSQPAYKRALKLGIVDDVCSHMQQNIKITIEEAYRISLEYSDFGTFCALDQSAYTKLKREGVLYDMCTHLESKATSDKDVFYIWEMVGLSFYGKRVYKIGVTSSRLGDDRIKRVSKRANVTQGQIIKIHTKSAKEIEQIALKYGDEVPLECFDGYTEVRALSSSDIKSIKTMAEEYDTTAE